MEVVVRQTSGLGNQLFQYAAGRYVAKKHLASLRIAHEIRENLHRNGAHRPVMLHKFAIRAPVAEASTLDRLVLSIRPGYAAAAKLLCAAARIQVIREAQDEFLKFREFEVSGASRTLYLKGFWQAHWIVQAVENELREEFSLNRPLSGRSLEVATRIGARSNPVSIHLRRGDYLTVFGTSAVLPLGYYTSAISLLRAEFPDSSFFVFSDDADYARQCFADDPKFTVVDHNDAQTADEDLVLMSLCRHHIIANSTFSWWGAWLNPRADKRVVAPSRWLGFETAKTTIAAPSWSFIDV